MNGKSSQFNNVLEGIPVFRIYLRISADLSRDTFFDSQQSWKEITYCMYLDWYELKRKSC